MTNEQLPIPHSPVNLLCLMQLVSPALPVGAYSYSEGLETLVDAGVIENLQHLGHWLKQELGYGAIRLEAAVMLRGYRGAIAGDLEALSYWNVWLSAAKETQELQAQSWQMGRSLIRLLLELQPQVRSMVDAIGSPCNYAIAFGIAAAHWQIDAASTLLGYLHSWATNLIAAGVKLIPLGQTAGQQLLLELQPILIQAAKEILGLEDDALSSCGWGLALASIAHETQYTRLFRS
ncbi:urease accessory protein UreF [Trichocoleus sp. DQ-A3]|uniref:urease accessory protein UreF n=1 Tax=Cyanophyceae TaxID=3028117 RepID=UPI001682FF98|nr:urease accessory protein UreF [Coleofasciculus sp. FACHB-125]MBD1898582.1 urease accessory protein UreF [Coleofasciculus sp. FACHB-125]